MNTVITTIASQQQEIESLRQQLAHREAQIVMLRDAVKFWMKAEGNYDLMKADKMLQEALAATDDLKEQGK